MNNKNRKSKVSSADYDLGEDLNEINTSARNAELDQEILKPGVEIAGLLLRPISAGDLALLLDLGVGILIGRMNNLFFDVGAILYSQSHPKQEIRTLSLRPGEFRSAVYDFLDTFEPDVFEEAQPLVLKMIATMNKSRTSVKGTLSSMEGKSGNQESPKAGGQAG
jgi:hypothetical protein